MVQKCKNRVELEKCCPAYFLAYFGFDTAENEPAKNLQKLKFANFPKFPRSNGPAARVLRQHKAEACTDVTGFGLLGHLTEFCAQARVAVTVHLGKAPCTGKVAKLVKLANFCNLF